MKILIFTEGTLIIPGVGKVLSREELVKQNLAGEEYFAEFANYIPVGEAVTKVTKWQEQGAEIHYLTSRTKQSEINVIRQVLEKHHFPSTSNLHYRQGNQTYANVAEELRPDILIEDDCESIGGDVEMTYPHIDNDLKPQIKSIVVKEFIGIDNLPMNFKHLLSW